MKRIEWKDLRDGQKVRMDITGGNNFTEGVIVFRYGSKYFVSDNPKLNGVYDSEMAKKRNKKYVWNLADSGAYSSGYNIVISMTAKEIEEYKDFQMGDKLVHTKSITRGKANIVFSNEYVVSILHNGSQYASTLVTRDELHKSGWRLDEIPVEEAPQIKEYTAAEAIKILAEKAGIDESQIRIKK